MRIPSLLPKESRKVPALQTFIYMDPKNECGGGDTCETKTLCSHLHTPHNACTRLNILTPINIRFLSAKLCASTT